MKPQEKPANSINLECKKIGLLPCFKAIAITITAQISFLAAFIVLVNFDILHPINWFLQLFGFHWLKHVPLLGILLANGLILSKTVLGTKKYYPNRFKWLLDNGIHKVILLTVELLLGLLTAWSFMSYLNAANSSLYAELNGLTCINSRYTFLTFVGIAAGCFYFWRYHLASEIHLQFEYIPTPTFIRLREALFKCFWMSARNAILPTISFAIFYWIFGSMLNRRLAVLLGVAVDDRLTTVFNIFTNFSLLLHAWLIVSEFFTLMNLMEQAFSIFLTKQYCFPISGNLIETNLVTLVVALSMSDVPVIQKLAALDFYNLAKTKSSERRKEIFMLSQPGGHPYNWNQLSGQCLSIINAYTDELKASLKSFAPILQTTSSNFSLHNGMQYGMQPSATELAQRILIRQYNEKHNIRHLKSELHPIEHKNSSSNSTVARINENFNRTTEEIIQRIINIFQSLPGLYYMFGEPEGAKLAHNLANSDLVLWIVQGIAYVCAASLNEDPYGVVQLSLPEIFRAILKLKAELDRLSSVTSNSKKLDPNLMPLKNALKRSLHKICNAFADYLPEIVEDPNDLPYLRTFLYHHSKC